MLDARFPRGCGPGKCGQYMLDASSHNQALLAFLALAEIEEEARRPLPETPTFSSFLTLLLGIQPDVERLAEQAGASAMLASALLERERPVEPRALARQFPREAPNLALAVQRLKGAREANEIHTALSQFLAAVGRGRELTLSYIIADFASDLRPVAEGWRVAAARGALLIRALARALGDRKLSGAEEETLPLLAFLDEAAAGGFSAIGADGTLNLPRLREGREARRVPVRCPATVLYAGAEIDAVVRDLSVTGLGLEGLEAVPEGGVVEVRAGTMSFLGRVEWAKGGRAGVRLDERIEAQDRRLSFLARG